MGEVLGSSEEVMEEVVVLQEEEEDLERKTGSLIKLESLMFLRVLLVESDDSTRMIVAALLRKCGYRVAAVSDGLKAWEILKGRSHNIDLVLTEVELPSISGFSLLSMIMEHEICKNVPVIMISSQDSVSVVFKCMLEGAADFLVKPVRKNELRNLWQHVWRRNSSSDGGHDHQDGNPVQQKVEATAENNSLTKHTSDCVACPNRHEECYLSEKRNVECSEKGSDAQSSCTKPDMDSESECMQNRHGLLQTKWSDSLMTDMNTLKYRECVKLDEKLCVHENEAEDMACSLVSDVAPCNQGNNSTGLITEECTTMRTLIQGEGVALETHKEKANIHNDETMDENNEQLQPSREAIDLIGAFDSHSDTYNTHFGKLLFNDEKIHSDSSDALDRYSSTPLLELSLKGFHQSDLNIQQADERHTLNHSNVSAFSRYNNRTVLSPFATSASFCTETKECASISGKHLSNQGPSNTAEVCSCNVFTLNNYLESMTSPCPQHGVITVPVPIRSRRVDSLQSGYDAVLPPTPAFYTQSGQPSPPPLWSSDSASQQRSSFHVKSSYPSNPETLHYHQAYCLHEENANKSTIQTMTKQPEQILESVENPRHASPATSQSAGGSLCNSAVSNLNSSECGSVSNRSDENDAAITVVKATVDSGSDESLFIPGGISRQLDFHCLSEREVALTKFRLKRKDRCYEKKVRYQSRKRLAEQRPRVKGQFVRQMPTYTLQPFVTT